MQSPNFYIKKHTHTHKHGPKAQNSHWSQKTHIRTDKNKAEQTMPKEST